MEAGWVELRRKTPDVLVMAVGRIALAFASLENGIAMLLVETGASTQSFEELSGTPLDKKLDNLAYLLKSKQMEGSIPIDRLRVLAKTRHDLLHGVAFLSMDETEFTELTVWNPFRNRARTVSPEELDKISEEVEHSVIQLPYRGYDIKNSPHP